MTDTSTILAIESAIRGGSISLVRDGREVANWLGSADVSKAEELLVDIDRMLTENDMTIRDINHVAVSAGPGSFTGIRIGIATALGLKNGLGITMSSVSTMQVIAEAADIDGKATVAVPVGRNAICRQIFSRRGTETVAVDKPTTVSPDEFATMISDGSKYVLHRSLYEQFDKPVSAIDFGETISVAIAAACARDPGKTTDPLFISKSF
ncbi:MAG: tRNA (adenosine(37)-N6)-threonylcarbamoyltransferase complex dimerization subunit type 1 TsaB [Pyrinomonadaceae bacterium]